MPADVRDNPNLTKMMGGVESLNDVNKTATPVYRKVISPVFRLLSRLKSSVAAGIDAHHERVVSLRVYPRDRMDGTSASNPAQTAQAGDK